MRKGTCIQGVKAVVRQTPSVNYSTHVQDIGCEIYQDGSTAQEQQD